MEVEMCRANSPEVHPDWKRFSDENKG